MVQSSYLAHVIKYSKRKLWFTTLIRSLGLSFFVLRYVYPIVMEMIILVWWVLLRIDFE